MLMQFCKGAGCAELAGMNAIESRGKYTLLRPLLHLEKQELLSYLNANNLNYFEDESNKDEKYKRNEFRHNYAKPLLDKYLSGIKKSFEYLDEDTQIDDIEILHVNELSYFKTLKNRRQNILHVDRILKERGFIIRQGDREILKSEDEHIVGRRYVVAQTPRYTFIAPFVKKSMTKEFKEQCRKLQIPKKLRPYLSDNEELFKLLSSLL
jgi:tRNA(Ile)-lysidine synthase